MINDFELSLSVFPEFSHSDMPTTTYNIKQPTDI